MSGIISRPITERINHFKELVLGGMESLGSNGKPLNPDMAEALRIARQDPELVDLDNLLIISTELRLSKRESR